MVNLMEIDKYIMSDNQQMSQQNILSSLECIALNENQLQPIQNIMDLQNYANFTNSPMKLVQTPVNNQQQLQQSAQVHTIMLNGQPALFIPASSSNILCQMLLNSNTNQMYEFVQPQVQQQQQQQQQQIQQNQQQQQYQIQINSNNDFASLIAAANAATNQSNQNTINLGGNTIQLDPNQNGGLTFVQLQNSVNTGLQNNENGQTIIKLEQDSLTNELLCLQQNGANIQFQLNTNQQYQIVTSDAINVATNNINTNIDINSKKQRKPKSNQSNKKMRLADYKVDGSGGGDDVATNLANELNSLIDQNEDPNGHMTQEEINQQWVILEGDITNGEKRKRKACECPNCVRWKNNEMTPEEMLKKRTHKCHKCGKEYNKTSHLRAHLRAHDNYRPYVCDFKVCGKSFTRSDELKRHKRIHNDDRNFPCPVCKKKFLRSDHLNKHMLVHTKHNNQLAANKLQQQQQQQQQQFQQQQDQLSQEQLNQIFGDAASSILPSTSSSPSSSTSLLLKLNGIQ